MHQQALRRGTAKVIEKPGRTGTQPVTQLQCGVDPYGFRIPGPAALKKMLHIREMGRALRGVEIVLGAKQQHLAGEITGMHRVFRHTRTTGVVEFHRPADLSQPPSLIGDLPSPPPPPSFPLPLPSSPLSFSFLPLLLFSFTPPSPYTLLSLSPSSFFIFHHHFFTTFIYFLFSYFFKLSFIQTNIHLLTFSFFMLPFCATSIHLTTDAFASSILLPHTYQLVLRLAFLMGDVRGCHVPSQSQTNGLGALCSPVALLPMTRNGRLLVLATVLFWLKPSSTFACLL